MPRAAVPVVGTHESKDAGPFDIEANVEVIGLLVKKVAGIGALVAAGAVIGAAQIRPRADPLVRPALPLAVGVQPDRKLRRLFGSNTDRQRE